MCLPDLPLNGGSLGAPPPSSVIPFGINDDTGVVRARSSGKVTAMQIRYYDRFDELIEKLSGLAPACHVC